MHIFTFNYKFLVPNIQYNNHVFLLREFTGTPDQKTTVHAVQLFLRILHVPEFTTPLSQHLLFEGRMLYIKFSNSL